MSPEARLIKKYSNRKLYDTTSRRYITLEKISELLQAGEDIRVIDRTNGEDLTAVTLSQVLLDTERKRSGAIPEKVLHQLLQVPGDVLGAGRQSISAVQDFLSAGQEFIQRAEERVVRTPEQALEDAMEATMRRLKIPSRRDVDRLERRVRDLTESLEAMKAEVASLRAGKRRT